MARGESAFRGKIGCGARDDTHRHAPQLSPAVSPNPCFSAWLRAGTRGRRRPLLETGAAQYRPALGRLEGDSSLFTALRTGRPGFRADACPAGAPLGLALLAALGVISELLVFEENLLAGGEDELRPAIDARQDSIGKYHGRSPKEGIVEIGHNLRSLPVPLPCLRTSSQQGPGPRERGAAI